MLGAPTKGKLTTDPGRIKQANKSKHEYAKFEKEQRMCKVLVDNGHDVRHLDDSRGGYDVEIDGIPYDLKSLSSANNIARHAKHAVHEQGAKGIVFEFTKFTGRHKTELEKLANKGIHGFYYDKVDYQLHEF